MIRLFMAGQQVPAWLEKVEANDTDSVLAPLLFNEPALVTVRGGGYYVRSIVGTGTPMRIADARNVTIAGQFPPGGHSPVAISCAPLLRYRDAAALLLALSLWLVQ